MSALHTPGPWEVTYLDDSGQRQVGAQHLEICTCWHHSVESIERQMEANARLIAAAPDLLAALIDWTAACDQNEEDAAFAAARAAIAKAFGETK